MKQTLGIVVGGRSVEHATSVESGESLCRALADSDFEPHVISLGRDGETRERAALHAFDRVLPLTSDPGIASLRDELGPRVLGNAPISVATALDKPHAKRLLRGAGLSVLPDVVVTRRELAARPRETLERIAAEIPAPWFVKPATGAASAGASVAARAADLLPALVRAASVGGAVIVEPFLDVREIEVAVVAGEASIPGELVFRAEFFDHATRTTPGALELVIPAMVGEGERARLRHLALAAAAVLGTMAVARVEFLRDRNTHSLYVNEVNPLPLFTAGAPFARLWEASGATAGALVARLAEAPEEEARPAAGT